VRFFELDQPATQTDKRRRLADIGGDLSGLWLVAIDFETGDGGSVLAAAGHDPARPTVFCCEGLLIYLGLDAGARLLGGLRRRAAAQSTLVASLATHAAGIDWDVAVAAANARRVNAVDEPWRTIRPADTYLSWIEGVGWPVTQALDASDITPGVNRGRTLLVAAAVRPD
jgi:methyltransferase (TIGR00027 family)